MVTLVLMGAGSSFGSKDVVPNVPPLGNGPVGLFAQLENHSTLARTLPERLKEQFRTDFELGMALYREHTHDNVMAFQRDIAGYLAQFSPGKNNEYCRFLQAIKLSRVVFSTLNYDLLFELSAASLGLPAHYSNNPSLGGVRLLKPHGSCNFWPNVPLGAIRNCQFVGSHIDIQAPVRPLNQLETLQRCRLDDSLAPAMAMYAKGKPLKVCPQYVVDQQTQWSATARQASNVFITGVRVHPSDNHLWDTLASTRANLTYFGLPGDHDEFSEWKETSKKRNASFIEGDFSFAVNFIGNRIG